MKTPQISPEPRRVKMGKIYGILALSLIVLILLIPKFVSADSTQSEETVIQQEYITSTDSLWDITDDFSKPQPIEIGYLKVQSVDKFFDYKDRTEPYELDIDFPEPIQSISQL